jgi:hypothetical protein
MIGWIESDTGIIVADISKRAEAAWQFVDTPLKKKDSLRNIENNEISIAHNCSVLYLHN